MKKFLKRTGILLLALVLAFSAFVLITGKTYLFKAVYYNFAGIDDYKIFSNNTVSTGLPQPWPVASTYNTTACPESLEKLLTRLQTVALLAVKDDSVVYEKYWGGYNDSSWS